MACGKLALAIFSIVILTIVSNKFECSYLKYGKRESLMVSTSTQGPLPVKFRVQIPYTSGTRDSFTLTLTCLSISTIRACALFHRRRKDMDVVIPPCLEIASFPVEARPSINTPTYQLHEQNSYMSRCEKRKFFHQVVRHSLILQCWRTCHSRDIHGSLPP